MTFGQFDFICQKSALPLCALVGPYGDAASSTPGIFPDCFARSIDLANTIIFQIGSAFINIGGLGVIGIMIFNIRTKYTAIGRREILDFFGLLMILTALSLVIDSGVVPPGSGPYPYFVAVQSGFTSAVCWCLMWNGLLGFQLWEDGTPRSKWFLRITTTAAWALTFVFALLTFRGWGGSAFNPQQTTALFVVLYVLNALFLFVYVVSQIVLTLFVLRDLWAFGAIALGTVFFVVGQVLLYAFSKDICENVKHYLDGLFFASLCNIFAGMMIYKYWDMITSEDLEFSVSNKESAWEVKELLEDDRRYEDGSDYDSVYPFGNNTTHSFVSHQPY